MKEAGFEFKVIKPEVEEDFPANIPAEQVAEYLARKKALFFAPVKGQEIVVTADTVVVLNGTILNKPSDRDDAVRMLRALSGNTHIVITGVSIMSSERQLAFQDRTEVTFKNLTDAEIEFYVDQYQPYDKAGAYGAQDWIGMVAVTHIKGSYFNVMGLPIHKVYEALADW